MTLERRSNRPRCSAADRCESFKDLICDLEHSLHIACNSQYIARETLARPAPNRLPPARVGEDTRRQVEVEHVATSAFLAARPRVAARETDVEEAVDLSRLNSGSRATKPDLLGAGHAAPMVIARFEQHRDQSPQWGWQDENLAGRASIDLQMLLHEAGRVWR